MRPRPCGSKPGRDALPACCQVASKSTCADATAPGCRPAASGCFPRARNSTVRAAGTSSGRATRLRTTPCERTPLTALSPWPGGRGCSVTHAQSSRVLTTPSACSRSSCLSARRAQLASLSMEGYRMRLPAEFAWAAFAVSSCQCWFVLRCASCSHMHSAVDGPGSVRLHSCCLLMQVAAPSRVRADLRV